MSDGSSRLDDLPRALEARLGHVPTSVLYLTRNDVEPARALEAAWPKARVLVRTKADFQGMSQLAIMKALRKERVELFVVHDRPAFMTTIADLYALSAIGVRARRRFLLTADFRSGQLVGDFTLKEVTPLGDGPGLAWRLTKERIDEVGEFRRARRDLSGWGRIERTMSVRPPYRIAYLRSDLSFVGLGAGGSVSHTIGVINGLRDAGHRVDVIAADHIPTLDTNDVREEVIPPVLKYRLNDEAAMIAYHHQFVRRAAEILQSWKPDLIYQRHAVFNATGAALARTLRVPFILEANHTEVEAKAMWSRLRDRALAEQFEKAAFDTADAIVAVSAIGKEALVRVGADGAKILVNPNGVDPEVFSPRVAGLGVRERLGFRYDEVVAGFLGTFTRWHGVLFLAEQIPPLVAKHPKLRFLFMGDGDLRSAVEDSLRAAGVVDRAVFTGLIPHFAVPEHLAAADILVSPHLPFEDGSPFFGSPTKLFEYMAMGKAVVASNLGQIGEVIEEGKSGILYGPGSAEGFRNAMDRVVSDAAFRRSLGEGARRRVESEFTWRRNAERAVAFLEERVSGHKEER